MECFNHVTDLDMTNISELCVDKEINTLSHLSINLVV